MAPTPIQTRTTPDLYAHRQQYLPLLALLGHAGPVQGCQPTAPNPQTLRHAQSCCDCVLGSAVPCCCSQHTPGQLCSVLPTRASCRNSGQQQLQSTAITSCLQGHAAAALAHSSPLSVSKSASSAKSH